MPPANCVISAKSPAIIIWILHQGTYLWLSVLPMKLLLAIGTGSFIGGVGRYLVSQFVQNKFLSTFAYGTLTVNIVGCFFIGLLFGLSEKAALTQEWRLFLVTGLLGSFTTFSAFSHETVSLLRDGQLGQAFLYISGSVLIGIVATFIGIFLTKFF